MSESLRPTAANLIVGDLAIHAPIFTDGPHTVWYSPDEEDAPTRFVIVRDGEDREAVVVERARFERLREAAKCHLSEWEYPGETPEQSLDKARLQSGDLDPLPERG